MTSFVNDPSANPVYVEEIGYASRPYTCDRQGCREFAEVRLVGYGTALHYCRPCLDWMGHMKAVRRDDTYAMPDRR